MAAETAEVDLSKGELPLDCDPVTAVGAELDLIRAIGIVDGK